jgi:hypothetical protein
MATHSPSWNTGANVWMSERSSGKWSRSTVLSALVIELRCMGMRVDCATSPPSRLNTAVE